MNIQEVFVETEKRFVEMLDNPDQLAIHRTLGVIALEKEMHASLGPWAKNHKSRYKKMGTLPYTPTLFKDQMINIPGREIAAWAVDPLHRQAYIKAIGSAEVAGRILNDFSSIPAFEEEDSISLVDFTAQMLEEGGSVAVATGHLDSLSDISDFTDGLNLAISQRYGSRYSNRFKVVVNKLMTRETMLHAPIPYLISIGLAPRWGLPLLGSTKWDVPAEAQEMVNGLLAKTLVAEQRQRGQVVGIVPAGSAVSQVKNPETGKLEKLVFPYSDATAALFARYDAIIPANRWGNQIKIGSAIPVVKPKGRTSRQYGHEITDHLNYVLALQASELAKVPVEFQRLSGPGSVVVEANSESQFIDAEE